MPPVSTERPVALVTGASSGFGLLASVELARRGLRVFASMRDLGKQTRLIDAARGAGVEVETVALDVTREPSIRAAVEHIAERTGGGGVDVLVNNAGFGLAGFFEDVDLAEFREQFETNFFGVIATTQTVLPHMRAQRRGRVINVSSIAGRLANPGMSAYCSSKWALEGLSESLRLELRPLGIDVVLIEPGTFKTDIFDRNRRVATRALDPASPNFRRAKRLEAFVDKLLARNHQDPADVARAIAHAATTRSPRLRYVVGRDARGEALGKAALPYRAVEWFILKYTGLDEA
jgi:NAD(P)-dependent dehydrogenase (short-subunit alcohol dehydrogenase family)